MVEPRQRFRRVRCDIVIKAATTPRPKLHRQAEQRAAKKGGARRRRPSRPSARTRRRAGHVDEHHREAAVVGRLLGEQARPRLHRRGAAGSRSDLVDLARRSCSFIVFAFGPLPPHPRAASRAFLPASSTSAPPAGALLGGVATGEHVLFGSSARIALDDPRSPSRRDGGEDVEADGDSRRPYSTGSGYFDASQPVTRSIGPNTRAACVARSVRGQQREDRRRRPIAPRRRAAGESSADGIETRRQRIRPSLRR